jgi:hypothetical protein
MGKAMQSIANLNAEVQSLREEMDDMQSVHSIEDEINRIPGRRLEYMLVGTQNFTIANNGLRAGPITMRISQDGPFVATHYPICMWRPSLPTNATSFGFWRPVWYGWNFPDQAAGITDLDQDVIALSYEVTDGGSQRNFQNAARPPMLQEPGRTMLLPHVTLWTPNSVVNFIPTYERIQFNAGGTPATQGTLVVGIPGYRIVNM